MSKRPTTTDDVHQLTAAEVRRQAAIYGEKRRAVIGELADIHAARLKGAPEPVRLSDHTKHARARAVEMLNGHAASFLKLPEPVDREAALLVERDAIDIILKALQGHEATARAADAVAWVQGHKAEWTVLCRDIVVTAVRLAALEGRAREMLHQLPDWAPGLPMGAVIGSGQSIYEGDTEDPTREARRAAVEQGVVTASEIRKAQNV
jgi:hypothetical protein